MTIRVDIKNTSRLSETPGNSSIEKWVKTTFLQFLDSGEVNIKIVDEDEGRALNEKWRNASGPTNVLSFSYIDTGEQKDRFAGIIGDILLCAPVIEREASEQGKSLDAHYAHMVIHGCLHLLGYDHLNKKDAEKMESIEIKIMNEIGFANPYDNGVEK